MNRGKRLVERHRARERERMEREKGSRKVKEEDGGIGVRGEGRMGWQRRVEDRERGEAIWKMERG